MRARQHVHADMLDTTPTRGTGFAAKGCDRLNRSAHPSHEHSCINPGGQLAWLGSLAIYDSDRHDADASCLCCACFACCAFEPTLSQQKCLILSPTQLR